MIVQFEFWILLSVGLVTALLALQFVFPRWYAAHFNGFQLNSSAEIFYARQAGLAIAVQGGLLIVAAFVQEIRLAVIGLVGLGKLVFIIFLWFNIGRLRGLVVTAIVDTIAVLACVALWLKL